MLNSYALALLEIKKNADAFSKYHDLSRRRRRWRCWKSQGKLVYWMKRGSKYWRFCLVRSFCINQPQVSYYPRWHAGSGTRRGGTLRKKHYSKHLNCIVLSSKTIINKADHFQALALDSPPFSNPKSPPPQAKEPSVVAFRGGLGAPVTQGARGWLYNGTHHPQPTKHLTQLHTREGGGCRTIQVFEKLPPKIFFSEDLELECHNIAIKKAIWN